jgi:hypothetical protein
VSGVSGFAPPVSEIVYMILTEEASTKSSPPKRILTVLVPFGVKVEVLVGYALTCCRRSVTAVLAGGRVKSRLSSIGASPDVEISDSRADIYIA